MLTVVTGAAGFIGSQLVAALNRAGVTEVLAVDDLENGAKVEEPCRGRDRRLPRQA